MTLGTQEINFGGTQKSAFGLIDTSEGIGMGTIDSQQRYAQTPIYNG